ncbi:hypothetical protein T492DRAFT_1049076 [Pavlovales sp. CCMP2436]|nr:hypothetical protein T492DRAFT_1049076 [Pavlovales sp. CCMP2436]
MDWRDGTGISVEELDSALADGDGDTADSMFRFLVHDAPAGRSPAGYGRSRTPGRSPVSPSKRPHTEAFNALFAGFSPVKRSSPGFRGSASVNTSPCTRASGQLKSTAGVFAAGSEECFRRQRTSIIPLISPSSNFMPGGARMRALAAVPRAEAVALSGMSPFMQGLPTPTASPLPPRQVAVFADQRSPLSTPRRQVVHAALGSAPHLAEAERPLRRSPRLEQPRLLLGADSESGGPREAPGAKSLQASASLAVSAMDERTRLGARHGTPPAAQPAAQPTPMASATTIGAPRTSPASVRHVPGTPTTVGTSVACTPIGAAESPGSDCTNLRTPVGSAKGLPNPHFARRINFTPMDPAGLRMPRGSVRKRADVFGAGNAPTELSASCAKLASLSNINSMLNNGHTPDPEPAPTARSPADARFDLSPQPGRMGTRGGYSSALLAQELLSDEEDGTAHCFAHPDLSDIFSALAPDEELCPIPPQLCEMSPATRRRSALRTLVQGHSPAAHALPGHSPGHSPGLTLRRELSAGTLESACGFLCAAEGDMQSPSPIQTLGAKAARCETPARRCASERASPAAPFSKHTPAAIRMGGFDVKFGSAGHAFMEGRQTASAEPTEQPPHALPHALHSLPTTPSSTWADAAESSAPTPTSAGRISFRVVSRVRSGELFARR